MKSAGKKNSFYWVIQLKMALLHQILLMWNIGSWFSLSKTHHWAFLNQRISFPYTCTSEITTVLSSVTATCYPMLLTSSILKALNLTGAEGVGNKKNTLAGRPLSLCTQQGEWPEPCLACSPNSGPVSSPAGKTCFFRTSVVRPLRSSFLIFLLCPWVDRAGLALQSC